MDAGVGYKSFIWRRSLHELNYGISQKKSPSLKHNQNDHI